MFPWTLAAVTGGLLLAGWSAIGAASLVLILFALPCSLVVAIRLGARISEIHAATHRQRLDRRHHDPTNLPKNRVDDPIVSRRRGGLLDG
jgi:HAMP domain-containing protein